MERKQGEKRKFWLGKEELLKICESMETFQLLYLIELAWKFVMKKTICKIWNELWKQHCAK